MYIKWYDGCFNEVSNNLNVTCTFHTESSAMLSLILQLWWDNLAILAPDWVYPANIYIDTNCTTGFGQQLFLNLILPRCFVLLSPWVSWFILDSSQPLKLLFISLLAH